MKKKTKRKNHRVFKGVLICFIILALIGLRYFYIKSSNFRPSFRATSGSICTKNIDIFSQNKAKIKKILIAENDFVQKGDKLAELDPSTIDAKIHQIKAKIAYEKEKANYFKFNEEKALEEYLNAKKDSSLDMQEINAKLSLLEKMQLLHKIEKAKSQVLEAKYTCLKEKKQKHTIYSPKNGQIKEINAFEDKVIHAKERLFTIADTDNIWVDMKILKKDLSKYKLGDSFNLEIQEVSEAKFQGKIFDIAPLDDRFQFINIKLSVNQLKESPSEKTYLLQSGMSANFVYE